MRKLNHSQSIAIMKAVIEEEKDLYTLIKKYKGTDEDFDFLYKNILVYRKMPFFNKIRGPKIL